MKSIFLASKTISFVPKKYFKNLIIIFIGILINSFLEMISLASIIPILLAFLDPDKITMLIENYKFFFINDLSLKFPNLKFEIFLLGLTIILFFFLIILKNLLAIIFVAYRAKVTYKISLDLKVSKIKSIIFSPYSSYLKRNNSNLLQEINRIRWEEKQIMKIRKSKYETSIYQKTFQYHFGSTF